MVSADAELAYVSDEASTAAAAKVFKVPTILTTVAAKSFSGPLLPELQAVWPDAKPVDRTSMNSWDDANFRKAVEATGSDDTATVREHMMAQPIEDFFSRNGRIREDGRMVHDMYLAQVKTPEASTGEWDLYEILATIPAEEAYRPLAESQCKLVQN